eukprot:gene13333-biopygen3501
MERLVFFPSFRRSGGCANGVRKVWQPQGKPTPACVRAGARAPVSQKPVFWCFLGTSLHWRDGSGPGWAGGGKPRCCRRRRLT